MVKETYVYTAQNNNVPAGGTATNTLSGVTVFDSAPPISNAPMPPTYDQAIGNTTTFAATRSYTTTNVAYNIPTTQTTTTYTTYGPNVPRPPQPSRHPTQQATIIHPPVVIIQQPILGPQPIYLTCPACHIQKLTRIEYEPSVRTHLMAALMCIVGLWCCFCLPYCCHTCMDAHHYCGNCDKFLGTYRGGS